MLRYNEVILQHISAMFPTQNKNTQIAIATLILNYTVSAMKSASSEIQTQCLTLVALLLDGLTDPEAKFRTMVALGTLISGSTKNIGTANSLELKERVRTCKMIVETKKVIEASDAVLRIL